MTGGQVYTLNMLYDRRKYTTSDGSKADGVTDVLKVLDKPALLYWAHKLGREGISLDEARKSSANIGTVAHARIEAWLRDMVFDESVVEKEIFDASSAGVEKFKRWWGETGFEVDVLEYPMVSDVLKIGGRADIFAKRGEKRALIDVKTSSGIYPEMRLQMGGYAELATNIHLTEGGAGWKTAGPRVVDEVWIARIGKDEPGDVDAVEIPASDLVLLRKVFRAMALNHYDLKRALSRR